MSDENKLTAIHEDILMIREDQKKMQSTLVRNTISLEKHELRTTMSERRIETLEEKNGKMLWWLLALFATLTVGIVVRGVTAQAQDLKSYQPPQQQAPRTRDFSR